MGRDPFCTLHIWDGTLFVPYKYGTGPFLYPTSILLIKRQAPIHYCPTKQSKLKDHIVIATRQVTYTVPVVWDILLYTW